jgi:hypothetical protein
MKGFAPWTPAFEASSNSPVPRLRAKTAANTGLHPQGYRPRESAPDGLQFEQGSSRRDFSAPRQSPAR